MQGQRMAAKPKKLRRLPLCLNKTGDTTIARGGVCVEVAGLGMRIRPVRFKTRTIELQSLLGDARILANFIGQTKHSSQARLHKLICPVRK